MTLFRFFFPLPFPKSVSPEDSEKRRTNYQAYRSYLNREGPKALGSKEIPKVWIVERQASLSGPLAAGSMHVFTVFPAVDNWYLTVNTRVPGWPSLCGMCDSWSQGCEVEPPCWAPHLVCLRLFLSFSLCSLTHVPPLSLSPSLSNK